MIRILALVAMITAGLTACAPYEAEPVSPYQWQQRQDRIQREEAERLTRCETMDQKSERYARECTPAGASQP
ncbi:MAG: hypothetical protein ACOH1E_00565 [Brevundimonas sp.]